MQNKKELGENINTNNGDDDDIKKHYFGILKGSDLKTNHILSKKRNLIGRCEEECDIIISSQTISSVHACIEFDTDNNQVWLSDSNSMNGTMVNRQRIVRNNRIQLRHGDTIKFGFDSISYVANFSDQFITDLDHERLHDREFVSVGSSQKESTSKLNRHITTKEKKKALKSEKQFPKKLSDPSANKLMKKLQDSRRELKELISSNRETKRNQEEKGEGSSSLTFPTAMGSVTIPLKNTFDSGDFEEYNDRNISFQVHTHPTDNTATTLDGSIEDIESDDSETKTLKKKLFRYNHVDSSFDSTVDQFQSGETKKEDNVLENSDTLRNKIQGKSVTIKGTPETNPTYKTRQLDQDQYHMSLLVDSVNSLAHNILRELGRQEKAMVPSATLNRPISDMIDKLQESKVLLKKILSSTRTFRAAAIAKEKELAEENKKLREDRILLRKDGPTKNNSTSIKNIGLNRNLRDQGVERFANELQRQLNEVSFKVQILELDLEKERNSKRQEDPEQIHFLIDVMKDEINMKSKELDDLRLQLANMSSSLYSGAAQSKIHATVLDQLRQLEEAKKAIYEYERRDRLKANEWNSVISENKRLRQTVSELQNVIHRQMTDMNVTLLQKEQKVQLWTSKIAEFASGGNETRRRAAEFIIAQFQEAEQRTNDYLRKVEEHKRQVAFIEIANTELKIEVNQLKDALRSTDPNQLVLENQSLKDMIQQMKIQGSVQRVLSLQRMNDNLSQHVRHYQEVERMLQSQIEKMEKQGIHFDEDSCINYLEMLLQEKERQLAKYRTKNNITRKEIRSRSSGEREVLKQNRTRKLQGLITQTQNVLDHTSDSTSTTEDALDTYHQDSVISLEALQVTAPAQEHSTTDGFNNEKNTSIMTDDSSIISSFEAEKEESDDYNISSHED